MKFLKTAVALVAAFALVGCGGGGGGTSTGGTYFTHSQLAQDFVYRLNVDAGYDVELVKTNTLQYNYIVVYDYDYGTYDAYDLTGYNPGEDIVSFLNWNESDFYYDLIPNANGTYEDYYTGILFEKTTVTSTDRLKMAALEEGVKIKKAAEVLNTQFGLSQERSLEVAKLATNLAKVSPENRTVELVDRYTQAITGHTYTQFQRAMLKKETGDASMLNSMIEDAAQMNGILPEQVNNLIGMAQK